MTDLWAKRIDRENSRFGLLVASQFNVLPKAKNAKREWLNWTHFFKPMVAVVRGFSDSLKPGQGVVVDDDKPITTLAEWHESLKNLSEEDKEKLRRLRERAFASFGTKEQQEQVFGKKKSEE